MGPAPRASAGALPRNPHPMSIPIRPLEKIREHLLTIDEAQIETHETVPGQVLLEEGTLNCRISLIVRGEIELLKRSDEGEEYEVGVLRAGQFLGLLSLSSGEPSFFTARARQCGTLLTMPRDRFLHLLHTRTDFNQLVAPLLLGNLVDRYRRVVKLHVEVAQLTRDLDREKQALEQTIAQLEATRNRLVQQEKLATLGQLTSGIAHEINNPIASLSRSVDAIGPHLLEMLRRPFEPELVPLAVDAFDRGLNRTSLQTEAQRQRMEELARSHPRLPRSLLRGLAQVEPDVLEQWLTTLNRLSLGSPGEVLERLMAGFEAGVLVRNARVAASRIGSIVTSLKSYSRQDRAQQEAVDLREGIQDTLVLFGYILKKFTVVVDLPPIPPVTCRPSELNQVWTNLILNACQAMGECGTLWVMCGGAGKDGVWVRIQDTGPGVPQALRDKIFESHFTTKQADALHASGLGLGLAIARGIIEKHYGRIDVHNAEDGGAVFTVTLPVEPPAHFSQADD
jgi:signal transduction histidine kinase